MPSLATAYAPSPGSPSVPAPDARLTIAPPPSLGHQRMAQLHEPERGERARLPRRVHVVVGARVERAHRHLLRVVHQHVDATEALDRRRRRSPRSRPARGRHRCTTSASPPRSAISPTVRAPVSASRSRIATAAPASAEPERDAASDALARAGDDRDLPVQHRPPRPSAAGYGATGTASRPVSQWRPAARRSSHLANAAGSVWPRSSGVGPDLVGDRLQRVDVEAVELGRVEPEDLRGLVDRDVVERLAAGTRWCTATCPRGAGSRCPT